MSKKRIILHDPTAERIWRAEGFPLRGKAKSKWLAYNMAMRARVFDDWTEDMLAQDSDALVLHLGCGLDSRCRRIKHPFSRWLDCDLPEVIDVRRRYFTESDTCQMRALDASEPKQIIALPDSACAVVVLEGLSMYLSGEELLAFLMALRDKYGEVRLLMDVYTVFGARASKLKNPVNELGVSRLYGIDDLPALLRGVKLRVKAEHSLTPERLIDELSTSEQILFRLLFTGKLYRRIYRLYELESIP